MAPIIETWKPATGFEHIYEVSNLGRVRGVDRVIVFKTRWGSYATKTVKGIVLKPLQGKYYLHVNLRKQGKLYTKYIHKLVAEAFLGPTPFGLYVLHGPGGKHDNRLENLSFGTIEKNMYEDKLRDGTLQCGERASSSKLKSTEVISLRKLASDGMSTRKLADMFKVNRSTVRLIIRRKIWKYVD